MQLKKRINKLEGKYLVSAEPDAMALFWWDLHLKTHPELTLPERPPDDWIEYYNGKRLEDLLSKLRGIERHGANKDKN